MKLGDQDKAWDSHMVCKSCTEYQRQSKIWQKERNKKQKREDTLHCFSQNELNDLVRDLNLSKSSAELLAFRLKQKTSCLMTHASPFIATGIKNSTIFYLKKGIWCTAQILFTFCKSLKCDIINPEIGDYSSTAARDH